MPSVRFWDGSVRFGRTDRRERSTCLTRALLPLIYYPDKSHLKWRRSEMLFREGQGSAMACVIWFWERKGFVS